MNSHTKEFLTKLSNLMEEYKASLEIEGDSYGGLQSITLEVHHPKTFDETYDEWLAEHPGQEYPWDDEKLYSYTEWIDLGFHVDVDKLRSLIK